MKDFLVVGRKMARNGRKMAIYESQIFIFFTYKMEKNRNQKKVFYLIVFDTMKISTCLAPQNVHQNFTFVKVINVVCGKMARNCLKMAN